MIELAALLWLWLAQPDAPRAAEVAHGRLAREHTILVTNGAPFYAPGTVTVQVGETVRWRSATNSDKHSVREALHGTFSLEIPPGGEVTQQFQRPGDYPYRCRYHPWMIGKIVVEPRRLDVAWQPSPPGRIVAGEGGVFVIGDGAQPDIARFAHGSVGVLRRAIRASVTPAVSADGSLWFAGEADGSVVRFADGAVSVQKIGAQVSALAASGGALWVYDAGAQRVGRFTEDAPAVQWIASVAVADMRGDPSGVLWAIAAARDKILQIDGHGNVVEFTVPASLGAPLALTPAAGGVWLLTDSGRLARLVDGRVDDYEISSAAGVRDLVTAAAGELWLLDGEEHRIGRVVPEVRTLARLQ